MYMGVLYTRRREKRGDVAWWVWFVSVHSPDFLLSPCMASIEWRR